MAWVPDRKPGTPGESSGRTTSRTLWFTAMNSASAGRQILLALIVGCVGLAGCGKDSASTQASEGTTSTSTPTAATPTTEQPSTTGAPAPTAMPTTAQPATTTPPTSPPPPPSPSAAPRAGPEYFSNEYGSSIAAFTSPSGNISCGILDGNAGCLVFDNSWDVPPPDEYCDATWGGSVEVENGPGRLTCVGGLLADGPALPYGYEIEHGPILCRSDETGVTCDNLTTGHGFKVSRASFDLY